MQTNTLSHGPFKTHVPETNEQKGAEKQHRRLQRSERQGVGSWGQSLKAPISTDLREFNNLWVQDELPIASLIQMLNL